jgi:predicted aldo/keto reductase-like oxidoreductase
MPQPRKPASVDRRDFLRHSATALAAGALALPAREAHTEGTPARVQRYNRLGRTGFEISDISFGSSRLRSDEALVHDAFERGVNYFDTAAGYKGGASETTIGRALEGKRDQVVIASKVQARADQSRDELMHVLEGSLRRLRTDRIDVYFNHAVNDVNRLKNPEWFEFVEQAVKQGKIRFTGMSGHGANLIECLDYALDNDLIDAMLVGYNFGQDPSFYQKFLGGFDWIAVQPDLPRVLKKAKAKDVGIVAMKTLMGARLNDMRPYEHADATFAQAAFRWTLSNPDVDALIVSMKSHELISEYLGASGAERVTSSDVRLLQRYAHKFGGSYCRHGCNACAGSCPRDVPIAEVLRTRMYATDYRDAELALEDYARLGAGASPCLSCSGAPCQSACPLGLRIPELTRSTHLLLGNA